MFEGNGVLKLEGDHLDLSYRNRETWPSFTPAGSIKGLVFSIGDPIAGPLIQLGNIISLAEEVLDWSNVIDPPHYHGSDQFRVVSGGEWRLADKVLPAGTYAFQESGYVYREHPGPAHMAWIMLVIGDRRGAKATLVRKRDHERLIDIPDDSFKPAKEGEAYAHPAGASGIAAIATTTGRCERGYLRGTYAELGEGEHGSSVTGLIGDEHAGPAIHILKYGPNQTVLPASVCATERLLVVSSGSCRIGDQPYLAGDIRVQRADALMAAVISGPEGMEATLVVADRRHRPMLLDADETAAPDWISDVERVHFQLAPLPGGLRRGAAT